MPTHGRTEAKGAREDALELIAAELERLRVLKEHELEARVEEVEGDLYVRTTKR